VRGLLVSRDLQYFIGGMIPNRPISVQGDADRDQIGDGKRNVFVKLTVVVRGRAK
jgi:hypothetical protein